MNDSAFALCIAGVPFCFRQAGGKSIFSIFEEKYAHFLLNNQMDSPSALTVKASISTPSNGKSPDLDVCVSGTKVFFSRGAMKAELDLKARHASVQLPLNITSVDTFLRVCLTFLLLEKNGFLMHAAGIVRDGNGYCFFGPSGAGKTTLAEKFARNEILSDEICALTLENGSVFLHSTPFWGDLARREGSWGQPVKAPLAGFFRIEKGVSFYCEAMKLSEGIKELMQSIVFYGASKDASQKLFGLAGDCLERVPVPRLFLAKETSSDALKKFLGQKIESQYVPA